MDCDQRTARKDEDSVSGVARSVGFVTTFSVELPYCHELGVHIRFVYNVPEEGAVSYHRAENLFAHPARPTPAIKKFVRQI